MTNFFTLVKFDNLSRHCPRCGALNNPYDIKVMGFDDVFARYECHNTRAPCIDCGGTGKQEEADPSGDDCEYCDGSGTQTCSCQYASDGAKLWEE